MTTEKEFEDRIRQKMDKLNKKFEELKQLSGEELPNKLWEVEREAALLREFIEQNNTEEIYRDVV